MLRWQADRGRPEWPVGNHLGQFDDYLHHERGQFDDDLHHGRGEFDYDLHHERAEFDDDLHHDLASTKRTNSDS